jgi:MoaA/NifB/PqqE/SkfB family radical SAM enzyme
MKWLVINCTNICNFKCITCLREYDRSSSIPMALLEKAIPQAKKLGYTGVSFTGGEPCFHPQFEEMVGLFAAEGFNLGFVSNGSMPERYAFMYQKYRKNLAFAAFSIDGSTAEIHDGIRQAGSFEKVKETIGRFVNAKVFTKMATCINKGNMQEVGNLVRLALELEVKAVNFTAVIETNENKEILLSEAEKLAVIGEIEQARSRYRIELNIASSLRASQGVDFCRVLNELTDLTINPQGEVVLCCDTTRDGAVIGSLEQRSFLELYCMSLEKVTRMKKIRAIALATTTPSHNFNTCEFCNKVLCKDISRTTPASLAA